MRVVLARAFMGQRATFGCLIVRDGSAVVGTSTLDAGTVRRVLALLAALTVLLLPVALPVANAEPNYPPVFYKISAETFTARVGGKIAFTAQTFKPGTAVDFAVAADGTTVSSGSTSAGADGIAHRTVTFTVAGGNTVTVTGTSDQGSPLSLTANIAVTAGNGSGGNTGGSDNNGTGGNGANGTGNNGTGGSPDGSGGSNHDPAPQADEASGVPFFGGGLPRTGGDIALTALIGLALLGGGTALVVAGRNRRTN